MQQTRRYIAHASFPFAHITDIVNVEMTDEASGLYKQLRTIIGTPVRTVLAAPFYAADGEIAGVVQVRPASTAPRFRCHPAPPHRCVPCRASVLKDALSTVRSAATSTARPSHPHECDAARRALDVRLRCGRSGATGTAPVRADSPATGRALADTARCRVWRLLQLTNKRDRASSSGAQRRKFEKEDEAVLQQLCGHIRHGQGNAIQYQRQVDKAAVAQQVMCAPRLWYGAGARACARAQRRGDGRGTGSRYWVRPALERDMACVLDLGGRVRRGVVVIVSCHQAR